MSYEVLLLGLLVGAANYCFRYLPLRPDESPNDFGKNH